MAKWKTWGDGEKIPYSDATSYEDINHMMDYRDYSDDTHAAAYGAAEKGRIWWNTTDLRYKFWDGSAVQTLPGAAGATGYKLTPNYTIYSSGGTTYAMDADGTVDYDDADPAVVHSSVFTALTAGGWAHTIPDTYTLASDIIIPAGTVNLMWTGGGPSTIIDVSDGYWVKFAAGNYDNIIIRQLQFDGDGANGVKAIDSTALSGSSQVLDECELSRLVFNNFQGTNSLPLDLDNFERGCIHNFNTWDTMSAAGRIHLHSDANAGNVQIYDFFMSGAGQSNVPMILCEAGALHVFNGHFHSLNSSKLALALKIYGNGESISYFWMHDCRGEYCQMLLLGRAGTETIKHGRFHDNTFRSDDASAVGVDIPDDCGQDFVFHDNRLDFSNGIPYRDANDSLNTGETTNKFHHNTVTGTPSYGTRTEVEDNHGYYVGQVTNYRVDTSRFGRGTNADYTSATTYLITGGDMFFHLSDAHITDITIYDYASNTIATGLTTFTGWLRSGMRIKITDDGTTATVTAYMRG